jgi:ribosomal protein S18 acetylase RimI-like enzyme
MALVIKRVAPAALGAYAAIPIAFDVRAVVEPVADPEAPGRWRLDEHAVAPYRKDYDAAPGEPPTAWPARFDLARWRLFLARDGDVEEDGAAVGGAAVTWDRPLAGELGGGADAAVLWDLRVVPERRGLGVGAALFRAAAAEAAARGYAALLVETQDVNVPACRFYAAMGCRLAAVRPGAYPALPDEVQLVWRREVGRGARGGSAAAAIRR